MCRYVCDLWNFDPQWWEAHQEYKRKHPDEVVADCAPIGSYADDRQLEKGFALWKKKRGMGIQELKSVAFKCTYNDGGEQPLVGFAGTCSLDNIARNVKDHRVWCSNQDCTCKKFSDKGMKGALPVDPCQEGVCSCIGGTALELFITVRGPAKRYR